MLTNNFVSVLRSGFLNKSINTIKSDGTETYIPAVGMERIGTALDSWKKTQDDEKISMNDYAIKMLLGTSDTQEQSTDYKLNIITNYTVLQQTHAVVKDEKKILPNILDCTRIIRNDSSEPITIKEIGLFVTTNPECILLAREVIEPVTLQPGEKHSFTMDICVE